MLKRLEFVHFSHRASSEGRITGGARKKEERERQEERDKKTKGKEALPDKRKKLRRGRLIFRKTRKEGTKGFIEAGYIV